MSLKKRRPERTLESTLTSRANIRVGNISNISGEVKIAGGDIIQNTGLSAGEIKQLFDPLYAKIAGRPRTSGTRKKQLASEVGEIEETVTEAAQKNKKVDEGFLSRRFRNIARMAPDILEVVVKTLVHPALGIGEVAKKIAEKAKEEPEAS